MSHTTETARLGGQTGAGYEPAGRAGHPECSAPAWHDAAHARRSETIPEQQSILAARDEVLAEGVHASDCCHPNEYRRCFCSPACRKRFGAALLPKLMAREAERSRRQARRLWQKNHCTRKDDADTRVLESGWS